MTLPPRRRAPGRAFTLIEVSVSLAILALLMLAMGSVILLASSAAPARQSVAEGTTQASLGVGQLAADAALATGIVSGQATSIVFTVPDRDANGSAETLYYHWSGTPGDPLLLSRNAGADAVVIDGVREMEMTYQLVPVSTTTVSAAVEGPETLLASYDPASFSVSSVTAVASIGQAFKPSLPADATAWSITKVKFRARISGATDGSVTLQLRTADAAGLPSATNLWTSTMAESTLTTTTDWRQATVTSVKNLSPSTNAALLLKYTSGTVAMGVGYVSGLSGLPLPMLTAPASLVWAPAIGSSMAYAIYGTITAPTTTVVTKKYLDRITISLRAGDAQSPRIETQVRVVCRPEVK